MFIYDSNKVRYISVDIIKKLEIEGETIKIYYNNDRIEFCRVTKVTLDTDDLHKIMNMSNSTYKK